MKRITVYRHPECARCRKFAHAHHLLDWLGRVGTSTDAPRTGPLRMGAIAVEDHATGEISFGVDAVRKIFRNIPAYAPFLPLLRIPAIARATEREVGGCDDGRCEVGAKPSRMS